MYSVVKVRECRWCHEPYYLSDGRYKYCSDECAEAADRARYGKKFGEPVKTFYEMERERRLKEYWRRCMEASRKKKSQRKL